MDDIYYEEFLSRIYDDSPYFGQGRSKEPDTFNRFYFEHLENKNERILEFGSGTGMLTIPLARSGYKLDSVDISPYMHKVLSEKLEKEDRKVAENVNQIIADAIAYQADDLYNSIVMPEGILIAIPDADLQMDLLRSCYRNLKPGGRIYTDFFQPRYNVIYNKEVSEYSRFRTQEGKLYLFNINYTSDEYTQVQNWHVIYTRIENEKEMETIELDVKFRYLFYSEVKLMLTLCGFNVIEIDVNYANGRGFSVIAEKI